MAPAPAATMAIEVTKRLTNQGKRHRLPPNTIALKHLKTSPRLTLCDAPQSPWEFSRQGDPWHQILLVPVLWILLDPNAWSLQRPCLCPDLPPPGPEIKQIFQPDKLLALKTTMIWKREPSKSLWASNWKCCSKYKLKKPPRTAVLYMIFHGEWLWRIGLEMTHPSLPPLFL